MAKLLPIHLKARTGMVFECRSEKTTRWCELLSIVLSEFNLPRRACYLLVSRPLARIFVPQERLLGHGRPARRFLRPACRCLKYSGPRLAITLPPFCPRLLANQKHTAVFS